MPKKNLAASARLGINAEVDAMVEAYDALCGLDPEAQERAMRWLSDRLRADRRDLDDEAPF